MKDWLSRSFRGLFQRYTHRLLARSLDGVFVAGLEEARQELSNGPRILAANHVGRWDTLLVLRLEAELGGEGRALMDAANLRNFAFFRPLGAIPLDRSNPLASRAGMRAAREGLQNPGDHLWIFPQGRQRPQEIRPLGLQPGIRLLGRVPVIPVSVSYHFRDTFQPAAYVSFGAPIQEEDLLPALEAALLSGLSRNLAAVESPDGAYRPLIPAPSVPAVDAPTRALSSFWRWYLGVAHG